MKVNNVSHWLLKSILALALIVCAGLSSYGIDRESIVGAWLFDLGTGQKAIDSSPNHFDGKFVNNPERGIGKYGGGIELVGGNEYIKVPHDWDGRQDLPQFTIAGWTKFSAVTGTYGCIVIKPSSGGGRRAFGIAIKSDGVAYGVLTIGGESRNVAGTIKVLDNTWHHAALTYDGKAMKIYVDGELDGEMPVEGDPDRVAGPIEIGRWGGTNYPIGMIDEVVIFNAALSDVDIQEIMKGLSEFMKVESAGKLTTTWSSVKRWTNIQRR